ncbi:hypothetical protein WAI453_006430 [Rhynchosporium graminicola]
MSAMHFIRDNDSLDVNRPNADRNLSVNGSNWLWAVTAVFGLTFLAWLVWTLLRNKQAPTHTHEVQKGNHNASNGFHDSPATIGTSLRLERVFHYMFTIAAFIGFISYYTMASDLGSTPIRQHLNHGSNPLQTRQVYYVRYIYWFAAWPLVLTANLILSGVSWATALFAIALQEIWVISWLSGALVTTSYKWGYYAFGLFAYFTLAYLLLTWGIEHSKRIRTSKDYTLLAGVLVLAWIAFPIAWGLCEGGNKLSVTGEMVFYGILDLIAIPIYGTLFLFQTRHFRPAQFQFTQTGRVRGGHDAAVPLTGGPFHGTV